MFDDKKYEDKIVRRLNQLVVEAEQLTRSGDEEGAKTLRREVVTILNSHPIAQRERIFERVQPEFFDQLDQTLLYAARQELSTRNQEVNLESE
jgi:hypothetical protein